MLVTQMWLPITPVRIRQAKQWRPTLPIEALHCGLTMLSVQICGDMAYYQDRQVLVSSFTSKIPPSPQ